MVASPAIDTGLRARFSWDRAVWSGSRAVLPAVHVCSGAPVWLHLGDPDLPEGRAVLGGGAQRAMLNHPTFARLLGCGRTRLDGRSVAFAALERLQGVPLCDAVVGDDHLAAMASAFLEGLFHLHRMGLGHGGISGRSVLMTEESLVLTHLARPTGSPSEDLEAVRRMLESRGLVVDSATDARSMARALAPRIGLALVSSQS